MGSLRVLYVDDDPDLREVVALSLAIDPDMQVEVAGSGAEALDLLRAGTGAPDIFLLDVMMPEMSGPELLERLRCQAAFTPVPVVFITARVQPQEVADLNDLGAAGVIAKPFNPMTLAGEVRRMTGL